MAESTMSFSWANGKAELGSQLTININRSSQSYVHELNVGIIQNGAEVGDRIWLAQAPNYATNKVVWTPPVSLAQYSTNDKVRIRFYLSTYDKKSDNTYWFVGGSTVYYPEIDVAIPSNIVPTLSDFTLSDTSGSFSKFGAYVATKSNLVAKITASGIYGSTIKQYKLSLGTVYATSSSSSITINANQLTTSGTINVTATATDTRNRYAQKTKQITVLPYSNPSLSGSIAYRFNTSSNKEDDESSTVRVHCVGNIASLNSKNTATIKVEYKLKSASSWNTYNTSSQGTSWNYNVDIPNLAPENAYDVRVTVTDGTGTQTVSAYEITTATPVMDFLANGKGIAFGKVSSSESFDVAMSATFEKTANFNDRASFNNGTSFNNAVTALNSGTVINGSDTGANLYMNNRSAIFLKDINKEDAVYLQTAGGAGQLGIHAKQVVFFDGADGNSNPGNYTDASTGGGTLLGVSHIYMRQNAAIMGLLTSGSWSSMLRMNTANQVELNWTSGGLKGRVMKQIWSGSWSSGSITVPEQGYYNLFLLQGPAHKFFATRSSDTVINGFYVAENANYGFVCAMEIGSTSSNVWSFRFRPWQWGFSSTAFQSGLYSQVAPITKIYGLL